MVLCYHSIHPSKEFASASPDLFERQLGWLQENCDLITFGEVPDAVAGSETGRPTVSITFDDGYADNHEYALPLLQRFGVRATFFVTVGLLEKDEAVMEHLRTLRAADRDDVAGLEWSQVQEMRAAGMEIGSHTYSHPNLARIDHARMADELRRSKSLLEDRLGEEVPTLAYPFGKPRIHFTKGVMDEAIAAGYRLAAAIQFRGVKSSDPPMSIPRFFATRNSLEVLSTKITGAWDMVGELQARVPLWAAKRVSPEDFSFE